MVREPGRAAATAVLWLATRGVVVLLYAGPQHWVSGDVSYFADSLRSLASQGPADTLREYPLAGVAVLAVPWLAASVLGGALGTYTWLLVALALLADAAFTAALHCVRGPGRSEALAIWLVGVPLLGATSLARFDIVPGVLAGAALLLLSRRPGLAGTAAAAGAAVKLWPALLLPAMAGRCESRGPVLRATAAVATFVVAGTVAVAGWGRLVSPLAFQSGRGLQIESVAASPAMVGWVVAPDSYTVSYGPAHAFEVTGAGVAALAHLSSVLTVLVAVGLMVLWWRLWRAGGTVPGVCWAGLAAVTGFVVSSRVLSPQYLLWLLPMAAAAVAVAGARRAAQLRWAAGLLVATLLTQLEFPVLYGDLVAFRPGSGLAVAVLAARNAVLVWLCAEAALHAWRVTAQRGIALARQPDGPDGRAVDSRR